MIVAADTFGVYNKRESKIMKNNKNTPELFPTLESVTRPTVETASAAFYLNRRSQTLRAWACHEDGPLRPVRVNGRLAWPVGEIKRVLGVQS